MEATKIPLLNLQCRKRRIIYDPNPNSLESEAKRQRHKKDKPKLRDLGQTKKDNKKSVRAKKGSKEGSKILPQTPKERNGCYNEEVSGSQMAGREKHCLEKMN